MSDIFNRLRSGAGKAAFEADKLRRIQSVQLKIRSLNQETEKEYNRVGQTAYSLYQKGEINQPELKAACGRLAAIFAQIRAYDREIEEIRAEEFLETASTIQYGHICPNGHGQIDLQNNFCQICGAKAIDVPPPSGAACVRCQALLQPGAQFCANCGQPVESPKISKPAENPCPNCGAPLLADAAFCTECGYKVVMPEPEQEQDLSETDVESDVEAEAAVVEPPASEPEIEEQQEDDEPPTETTESDLIGSEESPVPEALDMCPVCGSPLVEGAAFCTECGHRIT